MTLSICAALLICYNNDINIIIKNDKCLMDSSFDVQGGRYGQLI